MARNQIVQDVKSFIRQPVAFPGGYPKLLVMADAGTLCAKCAREEFRQVVAATKSGDKYSGWCAAAVTIHWEGQPHSCDQCGAATESAYGDPDDDADGR